MMRTKESVTSVFVGMLEMGSATEIDSGYIRGSHMIYGGGHMTYDGSSHDVSGWLYVTQWLT